MINQVVLNQEDFLKIISSINELKNYIRVEKDKETYYTIAEVCDKLKVSRQTLSNWEKVGLKIVRKQGILRINKKDLNEFLHGDNNDQD